MIRFRGRLGKAGSGCRGAAVREPSRTNAGLFGMLGVVVSLLLSITFACGVVIAVAHVANRSFVAPVYDVAANLTAFSCALGASILLGHWAPALFCSLAIACWLVLARRTMFARRR